MIGQIISERYRIDALLGVGGMGSVYRAEHVHMRKAVALKVLHRELTFVPEIVARFEREAVAAARISHPNVAAATDFGRVTADGAFYLALEFVEGRSLREELDDVGALSVSRVVHIIRQVGEALSAAHAHGIVHRDLKPENIMLVAGQPSDRVKVLDFGIAKVSGATSSGGAQLTQMGSVFGTPDYMSPEQAVGITVDFRTDLYSLGVILYEMLAGQKPFEGDTVQAILSQHILNAPPALPPHIHPALVQLCGALLEKDPTRRPASAASLARELSVLRLSILPRPSRHDWLGVASALLSRGQLFAAQTQRELGLFSERLNARIRPHRIRVWDGIKQRFPALAVLERPILVRHQRLPVGVAVAAVGAAAIALFTVVLVLNWTARPATSASEHAARSEASAAGSHHAETTADSNHLTQLDREALTDLLSIPVYKRSRSEWLTLAAAHAQHHEWKESSAAYRNALQLDPSLKRDPALLQHLRDLGQRPEAYDAVLNIALNLLDERGLDLVFDLWDANRSNPANATIAQAALKNLEIFRLRSASNALRVRLELQFARSGECDKISKLLTDAVRFADQRAVGELEKLRRTQGCGPSKKRDCYSCLRSRERELEAAIAAAKSRRAPRFDGQRYVPGASSL